MNKERFQKYMEEVLEELERVNFHLCVIESQPPKEDLAEFIARIVLLHFAYDKPAKEAADCINLEFNKVSEKVRPSRVI